MRFAANSMEVDEDAGTASVMLKRFGPTDSAISVDYDFEGDDAIAGVDFIATPGTATFAIGESMAEISIPIINNPEFEPAGAFDVKGPKASTLCVGPIKRLAVGG